MLEEQSELTKPVRMQLFPCSECQNSLGCFGVSPHLVAGHPALSLAGSFHRFALRSLLELMGINHLCSLILPQLQGLQRAWCGFAKL